MSSFTQSLLEDGVEVELPARLSDVIGMLDEDVVGFSCEENGYRLAPAKGQVGSHWDLLIKLVNPDGSDSTDSMVGRLELDKIDGDMVLFRIPPLQEQQSADAANTNLDLRLFGAFVYQVLNSFQQRQLINLPGPLPVF